MQAAASTANFMLRMQDIPAVLDQLKLWNAATNHPLVGRLDLGRIGMPGHSFGAVTTQAVSGQSLPSGDQPFTDQRIRAAIAFSPSIPRGMSGDKAFGGVKIPWLLMMGTKDLSIIGNADMKSRLRSIRHCKARRNMKSSCMTPAAFALVPPYQTNLTFKRANHPECGHFLHHAISHPWP